MTNFTKTFNMKKILEILRILIIITDYITIGHLNTDFKNPFISSTLIALNISLIIITITKLNMKKEESYRYLPQSIFYGSIATGLFSLMIIIHSIFFDN